MLFLLFTVMGIAFFKGLPIKMLLKSVEYEDNRSRYVMICLDLKYTYDFHGFSRS